MSNDKKFSALVAKSRSIYNRRIKEAEYHSLIQKSSVSQVIGMLKELDRYKADLSSVNETQTHRGQIEIMLEKSVFDIYIKLKKFIPTTLSGFNDFYIYKKELDIILDTIMFVHLKQYDSIIAHLPVYLSDHLSFDLDPIAKARSFEDLRKALSGTRYGKILNIAFPHGDMKSDATLNFEELVINMYTQYYKWLLKRIDEEFCGNDKQVMNNEVLRQVNLENLLMIYRMKRYFNRTPDKISRVIFMIKKGAMLKESDAFINDKDGADKILEYIEKQVFKGRIAADKAFLELSAEKDVYRRHHSRLRIENNGLITFYSLIKLLEIEKNNITTIIEGVRYSLSPQEIEKLIVI